MSERGAVSVRTDVLLALVVTAVQVLGVLIRGPEVSERPITDLAGLGVVLLVLPGLALVVRRRRPGAVLAIAALASGIYYLFDFSDGPGWLALFVALYTLTAYGDGRRALRIAAITIALLAAVWLVAAMDIEPAQAIGWVWFRIGAAVMSAALGESSRARQVILDEAVARAELAERSREEETRARVADERVRIARDVHDTVAHAIAIVNVQAGVTAHVLDKRPDLARENLIVIEQTSSRALAEMRSILGMLRSGDDTRAPTPGLADVHELLERAREAGLQVDWQDTVPATAAVPSAVGAAAYRIVQESLTNVIRHVGPTRVAVGVTTEAEVLCVAVTDDGSRDGGAVPDSGGPAPGHGIRGMRERCELLGGRLEARPRAGQGFEVHARLPLVLRAEAPS
ncbi:MAG: sensor histidine kinase [Nocardioides sp.]